MCANAQYVYLCISTIIRNIHLKTFATIHAKISVDFNI